MGLGAQLLLWRKGFCEKLVNQGLRVIRYDNRDVGLSSKVTAATRARKLLPRMVRSFLGKPSPAVYTLEDWPTTPPRCWTTWASTARTSSARRWAA